MKPNDESKIMKPRKNALSIMLYIAAVIVALVGIALLADNIYIYKSTIAQYVAQGYPAADVEKSLIPTQLLPGIFEPVAVYWGIALLLLSAGICNQKVSECLIKLAKTEAPNTVAVESAAEQEALNTSSDESDAEPGAENPEKAED